MITAFVLALSLFVFQEGLVLNPDPNSHVVRRGVTFYPCENNDVDPYAVADWKAMDARWKILRSDTDEAQEQCSLLDLKLAREKRYASGIESYPVRVFNLYCHPDRIKTYSHKYHWIKPGPSDVNFEYLVASVEFLEGPLRGKKMLINAKFLKSMVTPEQAERIRKRLGIKDESENDKPPLIPGQTKPRD
jgi:hypothetical protein